ncbi:MAG: protein-L-isoaspartate(D-aspartate) O-methyltransferase [Thiotrichales bacterium]|nr:protein-L-isoaspartate(D-aspartate) O-methyltransferase [Thiotrichales bacterium]
MSIKAHHVGIGMTSQRTRERLVQRLKEEGITDPRVLEVIRQTPRHIFVEEALASRAYEDTALPIGHGQTISQPYIVARMTELIIDEGECKTVLEIGTGCGYQTAILSKLFDKVNTVERIGPLLDGARRRFAEMSLRNIRPRLTDGGEGWPSHAPFDAIIVTAAPEEIPEGLLSQLAIGGRLVIPVGKEGSQVLVRIVRENATRYVREDIEKVSFVPMLGGVK